MNAALLTFSIVLVQFIVYLHPSIAVSVDQLEGIDRVGEMG